MALLGLVALTGCGTTIGAIQQCRKSDIVISTRNSELALPKGCRVAQANGAGVLTLACEGGRVGFAFDDSALAGQ